MIELTLAPAYPVELELTSPTGRVQINAAPSVTLALAALIGSALPSSQVYDVQYEASGPISSGRALRIDGDGRVGYPDRTLADDALRVAGVLVTSASSFGDVVVVRRRGVLVEAGWSWTPGPVFVGDNGALTQVAPVSGWLLQIGIAVNATTLDINPEEPIL